MHSRADRFEVRPCLISIVGTLTCIEDARIHHYKHVSQGVNVEDVKRWAIQVIHMGGRSKELLSRAIEFFQGDPLMALAVIILLLAVIIWCRAYLRRTKP